MTFQNIFKNKTIHGDNNDDDEADAGYDDDDADYDDDDERN